MVVKNQWLSSTILSHAYPEWNFFSLLFFNLIDINDKGRNIGFLNESLIFNIFLFHIMFEFDILRFFVLRNSFVREIIGYLKEISFLLFVY